MEAASIIEHNIQKTDKYTSNQGRQPYTHQKKHQIKSGERCGKQ